MSAVAMAPRVTALDTNCGYFTRALSSRDGCRGVFGLFDDAESPRAPPFAPLRLLGCGLGWKC